MGEGAPSRVLSVLEFTNGVAAWFRSKAWLRDISISGEVSGARPFGNGHIGFTLKEGSAVLECILFADTQREPPTITNGSAVVATGRIDVRLERSGYQLIVTSVRPTGIGALFQQYERLKNQFRSEGLFESSRKRAVPALPRRVALISARAKGAEDFMATIASKVPFVAVTFIETRVQGQGAEIDIASAIDAASQLDVDVVVLTRGGGSYEDLFPFNLEPVVRAIIRSRHPVVTAIGHESDHHLADDVADMQFGTPSKASEFIASGWLSALARLGVLVRDLDRAAQLALGRGAQSLESLRERTLRSAGRIVSQKRAALVARVQRVERNNPQRVLAEQLSRVVAGNARMDAGVRRAIDRAARARSDGAVLLDRSVGEFYAGLGRRCERAGAALDRLDPQAPLLRGYAIVTRAGVAVTNAGDLSSGEHLEARFGRGTASLRVETPYPDA